MSETFSYDDLDDPEGAAFWMQSMPKMPEGVYSADDLRAWLKEHGISVEEYRRSHQFAYLSRVRLPVAGPDFVGELAYPWLRDL